MPKIHPTAVVSPQCELAEPAEVGPYCTPTGPIRLADGVRLIGHN